MRGSGEAFGRHREPVRAGAGAEDGEPGACLATLVLKGDASRRLPHARDPTARDHRRALALELAPDLAGHVGEIDDARGRRMQRGDASAVRLQFGELRGGEPS